MIQWRKDKQMVLSAEQLDSNVKRKKKKLSSVLSLFPQYTDTNHYHFLWAAGISSPGSCQYILPLPDPAISGPTIPESGQTHRAHDNF